MSNGHRHNAPMLHRRLPEGAGGDGTTLRPSSAFVEFKKEWIERSIPDLFQRQVAANPLRTAVKTENHSLSYLALDEQANQIARAILSQRGEGQETIALLLEHDAPIIATILGVLKAGKIYMPLDPWNPITRTTFMIGAAQAELIISDSRNLSLANQLAGHRGQILNIDDSDAGISKKSPDLPLSADTPAYIFYTSGSTGQPKGVVDNHRNVAHNIMRYTNSLQISANDRLTLLQACSFSGSVSSIFSALLNGGTLLPFDLRKHGPDHLAHWLNAEKITVYHSVPTIFRSFLNGELSFPWLRVVRLEGDRASLADISLYKKYFSSECVLVNGLGATETGIVCQFFINKQSQLAGGIVPVGYPARDMEVLLLDDAGNEVEKGALGEIAVRSNYVAVGYWRNPALTSTKFLPDPDCEERRTYLTGDLGRLREDSCLEYLGRKDFQLKIGGQRVDAAEVETALENVTSIKQAVIISQEDKSGEPRLIAYLVLENAELTPAVSFLRRALSRMLPEYMIPSSFVFLDALPLNSNGKVDRRGLPAPDENQNEEKSDAKPVAPRGPTEKTLTKIWAEVLGLKKVSIYDDFFGLGGDSLRATQVISRIIAAFGLALSPRDIFESRTVESLGLIIDRQIAERSASENGAPDTTTMHRRGFNEKAKESRPTVLTIDRPLENEASSQTGAETTTTDRAYHSIDQ